MQVAAGDVDVTSTRPLAVCLLGFAVIFSADSFLDIYGDASSQIRTVTLMVLLTYVLRYRFEPGPESVRLTLEPS